MPEELAGKDVEIDVVPGYDVVPELPAPESLDELLANEPRQTIAPRAVVLQFRVPSQGIAYRGHVTAAAAAFHARRAEARRTATTAPTRSRAGRAPWCRSTGSSRARTR